MSDKEVVLHTRLRFKPEGSDKYVIALVETSAEDVLVKTPFMDFYDGNGTLKDLLSAIEKNFVQKPILLEANEFKELNPVLQEGQLGIETDTGIIKFGDGKSNYNDILLYIQPQQLSTESLNLEGMSVMNNNTVTGQVSDTDNTRSATLHVTAEDGKDISINASDLSVGTDNYHSSNIFFEVKGNMNDSTNE